MVSTSRTYSVAIYEAEPDEGGYWCEVIDLPGCVAQGETLDQLKENMIEAIIACEETLRELGDESRTPRPRWTWSVPLEWDAEVDGPVLV